MHVFILLTHEWGGWDITRVWAGEEKRQEAYAALFQLQDNPPDQQTGEDYEIREFLASEDGSLTEYIRVQDDPVVSVPLADLNKSAKSSLRLKV